MRLVQWPMRVVALAYALLAALSALVGSFADGGDTFARFLLTLGHPLGAVALVAVAFVRPLDRGLHAASLAVMVAVAAADGFIATSIALGAVDGEWWLPAVLGVPPLLGVAYALALWRARGQGA